MTHLIEMEFFDEYDNISEIENIVKKKRYNKAFSLLNNMFNHECKAWVTSKLVQEKLGMIDRSNTYQILESFRILNMLKKNIKRGRAYYSPINPEYWDIAVNILAPSDGASDDNRKAGLPTTLVKRGA